MGIDVAVLALVLLVGIPFLTFVHELGHALVAAAAVGGRVTVLQGPDPVRAELSVWRLDLRLHGLPAPHKAWVGWAHWRTDAPPLRDALALAGGPFASFLSAAACAGGAYATTGIARWALVALALDAAAQLTSTSLPVRYPAFSGAYAGAASDGYLIRQLLNGEAPLPQGPAQPAPSLPGPAEAI